MERKFLVLLVPILTAAFVTSDFGATVTESSIALAQKKKRQGVFQRLFRPRDLPPEMGIQPRAIPPRATSPRNSSPSRRGVPQPSGMRTLCVRACDGYYFPISYAASRKRFKIDEAVCKAMYGGAEANLFVHHNGSPPETAVSLKAKPLAREPYAFAFRESFNEACHAELKDGLRRLASAFLAKAAPQSLRQAETSGPSSPPYPPGRVIAGIDPETAANRVGGFVAEPVLSPTDAAIAAASKMRKLGSDYYYAEPITIANLRDRPRRGPEFALIGSAKADQGTE